MADEGDVRAVWSGPPTEHGSARCVRSRGHARHITRSILQGEKRRIRGIATQHVIGAGRKRKSGAGEYGCAVGARNKHVQVAISRVGYGAVKTRNRMIATRNVMSAWETIKRRG